MSSLQWDKNLFLNLSSILLVQGKGDFIFISPQFWYENKFQVFTNLYAVSTKSLWFFLIRCCTPCASAWRNEPYIQYNFVLKNVAVTPLSYTSQYFHFKNISRYKDGVDFIMEWILKNIERERGWPYNFPVNFPGQVQFRKFGIILGCFGSTVEAGMENRGRIDMVKG